MPFLIQALGLTCQRTDVSRFPDLDWHKYRLALWSTPVNNLTSLSFLEMENMVLMWHTQPLWTIVFTDCSAIVVGLTQGSVACLPAVPSSELRDSRGDVAMKYLFVTPTSSSVHFWIEFSGFPGG